MSAGSTIQNEAKLFGMSAATPASETLSDCGKVDTTLPESAFSAAPVWTVDYGPNVLESNLIPITGPYFSFRAIEVEYVDRRNG